MSFTILKAALAAFASRLERDCGRSLVDPVTVDEPSDEMTELDFMKLVNWGYVATNEAAQMPLRFVGTLMRVSKPEQHADVSDVRRLVLNLRTAQAHNLPDSSESNRHKARQARIWLDQIGGEPRDWSQCCAALLQRLTLMMSAFDETWTDATANEEDKRLNVVRLLQAVEATWEPHIFDDMVRSAASELELDGLDVVTYRQARLESWRQLASYFDNRSAAERWVQEAIHKELGALFKR